MSRKEMEREQKMSRYEIRRETTEGVSYRGAMMGRTVKRVRYVVYKDGAVFCPFTKRTDAENCINYMERHGVKALVRRYMGAQS